MSFYVLTPVSLNAAVADNCKINFEALRSVDTISKEFLTDASGFCQSFRTGSKEPISEKKFEPRSESEKVLSSYLSAIINDKQFKYETFKNSTDKAFNLSVFLYAEYQSLSSGSVNSVKEAIDLYEKVADSGGSLSKYAKKRLASIYISKNTATRDLDRALTLIEEISRDINFANFYFKVAVTIGAQGEPEVANKIFKILADKSHKESMFNLGVSYLLGKGIQANEKGAIDFLSESASLGYTKANKQLAAIYYRKEDLNAAKKWIKPVAESGDIEAMYIYGDLILSSKVIDNSESMLGRDYLEKAFQGGNNSSGFNLMLYNRLLFMKYKECKFVYKARKILDTLESRVGLRDELRKEKKTLSNTEC